MSGRAVPNVGPIRQEDIPSTIEFVSKQTGVVFTDLHPLGSVGKVPVSGDIDLAISNRTYNSAWIHSRLEEKVGESNCVYNRGTGVCSYAVPICGSAKNGLTQVDLMFVDNIDWAKFAYFSDPNSKYKGAVRTMLLMGIVATMNSNGIDYFRYDDSGQLLVRAGSTFDLNRGIRRIFQYRPKRKNGSGYLKSMLTVSREEFETLFPDLHLAPAITILDPTFAVEVMFGDYSLTPADVGTAEQVLNLIRQTFRKERQQAIFEKAATRVTKGKFVLPPEIQAYVK